MAAQMICATVSAVARCWYAVIADWPLSPFGTWEVWALIAAPLWSLEWDEGDG